MIVLNPSDVIRLSILLEEELADRAKRQIIKRLEYEAKNEHIRNLENARRNKK